MTIRFGRLAALALPAVVAIVLLALAAAVTAASLPAGIVDREQVSVSGLSSGGFMAVQLHVAHSATFKRGAGVVAGGPYFCAEGLLANALDRCMAHGTEIPVARLVSTTTNWAASGLIDPVTHLQASRAYLFSGTRDTVVSPAVVRDLQAYYRSFMPEDSIVLKDDVPAEHAMVTEDFGSTCSTRGEPFINDCDFDLAGAMLAHLHGPLNPRSGAALGGRFLEFDQGDFVAGRGMAATGWAYIPADCSAEARCALHVVLHGCRQNEGDVGEQYVRNTGYNRWADSNRIVVLYPQTGAGAVNSCWDWWGYDSADYARKAGPQMAAIKAMVDRLSGSAPGEPPVSEPDARCFSDSNLGHYFAGRATMVWGVVYAIGSGEPLGWWFGSSTLREDPPGHYALGPCQ